MSSGFLMVRDLFRQNRIMYNFNKTDLVTLSGICQHLSNILHDLVLAHLCGVPNKWRDSTKINEM